MAAPLNERDQIQLNAYLDGELSDAERAALERRMAQDAALRAEFESLRATVALLGMAERIRVPRSFTLDPAVYGKPARGGRFQWLIPARAAALASLGALVVVALVGGALLLRGLVGGAAAPSVAMEPAPAGPEVMMMAPAEEAAPSAEEPQVDMMSATTEPLAQVPSAETPEVPPALAGIAPTSTGAPTPAAGQPAAEGGGETRSAGPSPQPAPTQVPALPSETISAYNAQVVTPEPGVAAAAEPQEMMPATQVQEGATEGSFKTQLPSVPTRTILIVTVVVVGGIVLTLVVGLTLARRR